MSLSPDQYQRIKPAIESVLNNTEGHPWYWYKYGEKCEVYAVVEAIPLNEYDDVPEPGTMLQWHPEKERVLVGNNGTKMTIMDDIATNENSNGGVICEFIARVHHELVGCSSLPSS